LNCESAGLFSSRNLRTNSVTERDDEVVTCPWPPTET